MCVCVCTSKEVVTVEGTPRDTSAWSNMGGHLNERVEKGCGGGVTPQEGGQEVPHTHSP